MVVIIFCQKNLNNEDNGTVIAGLLLIQEW